MNARTSKDFLVDHRFADRLSHWVDGYGFGACFRGQGWGEYLGLSFTAMAAAGIHRQLTGPLSEVQSMAGQTGDYLIVHLAYDIKNQLEDLRSENPDRIGIAPCGWIVPELVVIVSGDTASFKWHSSSYSENDIDELFRQICEMQDPQTEMHFTSPTPTARMGKDDYLHRISSVQRHIQRGDVYQANICQEFYWEGVRFSPSAVFSHAFAEMPNPFAVFYKYEGKYCLCLSPERFLTFNDTAVLSQPMKGTAARSQDPVVDRANAEKLRYSEKDRRENVMIVDMVRHDLSKFAQRASVRVPELYRIKTYPKVHQMYSTVTAEMRSGTGLFDVLLGAFPMGSMTGAPKVRAMQLIEDIESCQRGLFSGTIGFVTPEGNADFNVVIRSLLYNPETAYLSCQVGGGITAMSDAEAEYEECLVKFEPIRQFIDSLAHPASPRLSKPTFAGSWKP